ncbi:hypothetical protein HAU32_11155 [Weissella confusa]|uniref:PTS EIIA type-1 domain-containing protein n=1 Tax=Weissella fermenti TaxID=2987699 RepID=A0ABT6D766_9LACO|nr:MULTISPECIES: hypothetical protein [Weissella]MBJ7689495.1 hypothetical protein [Weissella confusa]MCW0927700.1 hypothetical protein [Weissella sp. LMG 11983]MDF9300998.1 hypothetical protein [Weissella sp. BK2]
MTFIQDGLEVTLEPSVTLPGYTISVKEETKIPSPLSNPFFKGLNILQLPKMMKGLRQNADLQTMLLPVAVPTDVTAELAANQVAVFVPSQQLADEHRLHVSTQYFGSGVEIKPTFINLGLKDVKLASGTVLGTVLIQTVEI